MSRDGFDAWLRTPLPDLGIIENPSAMYTGWALDGTEPDWELNALADSPQAVALEVYLYDYHGEATATQTALLMLAGAGRFAHAGTEAPVLYWGGDVCLGLPEHGDEPLAVMLVGNSCARFVAAHPLDTLIGELAPVETDFLAATADETPTEAPLTLLLDPVLRPYHPAPEPTPHPCRPALPDMEER